MVYRDSDEARSRAEEQQGRSEVRQDATMD
jgi:hypothetical protein